MGRETVFNLFDTTIAGHGSPSVGYTAGDGSITLNSASGLPASPATYTLVIRDATTKAVKLLFRVATRSGSVVSGAAEGADANAAIGDLVSGYIFSAAGVQKLLDEDEADWSGFGTFANLPSTVGAKHGQRYKCSDSQYDMIFDSVSGLWRPMHQGIVCTRPDISTFTNFGSAPTVSDNTRGPFMMQLTSPSNGYNWCGYQKPIPSTSPASTGYCITLGFRGWFFGGPAEQGYFSLILRKSTGEFWAHGIGDNPDGDGLIYFTDATTYGGSNPRSATNIYWAYRDTKFIRLFDDGANWTSYIGFGDAIDPNSLSNTNWVQQMQQTHNNIITPGQCGFAMSTHNDSSRIQIMEVVHFSAVVVP